MAQRLASPGDATGSFTIFLQGKADREARAWIGRKHQEKAAGGAHTLSCTKPDGSGSCGGQKAPIFRRLLHPEPIPKSASAIPAAKWAMQNNAP